MNDLLLVALMPPELLICFPVLGPLLIAWPLLVLFERDRTEPTHVTRWVLAIVWMAPHVLAPWVGLLALTLFPGLGKSGGDPSSGFAGMALAISLIFYGLFVVLPAFLAIAVLLLRSPTAFEQQTRSRLKVVGVVLLGLAAAIVLGLGALG